MFSGPWELLILAAIVLLLFGSKRIPGLMRAMGQSIVEFKKGVKGIEGDDNEENEKKESS